MLTTDIDATRVRKVYDILFNHLLLYTLKLKLYHTCMEYLNEAL